MSRSFLDIIRKQLGDGDYPGDTHGGATGKDGSGLPTGDARNFMFATGIECSYPTIDGGRIRRDELEECGHYRHWRKDLQLVRDLGLKYLRYGLPYYSVHQGPGKYDWEFADQALAEIRRLGITPILDLLHFGVPDWLGDFQNPELPLYFAEYVEAVAERYPWVRFYTPVNEIYVTARVSARDGLWNEQLKSDAGFVTAIKNCVAASILACHAIARHRPDAIIVQSESAEYLHDASVVQRPELTLKNKLRFLSLDLLYAHSPDAEVYEYIMDNGLTPDEYRWFMAGEPPGHQVIGNDYYGRNERIVKPDGSILTAADVYGWYLMTRMYHERYRKPVFYSETNVFDAAEAPAWIWKQWMNVLRLRQDGVPVLGFTWYSLTDQIDWDVELSEKNGTVNECGLYDLDRRPRPVAAAFRDILENFGQITEVPRGEVFEVTDRAAELKVQV